MADASGSKVVRTLRVRDTAWQTERATSSGLCIQPSTYPTILIIGLFGAPASGEIKSAARGRRIRLKPGLQTLAPNF
ncbi:hypothetical protein SAMN02745166_02974 [Prosthecobacter debontii]|uniref:Uncharacterized protein n=1 Tax=Prosthecobacter debontii TaxID=48467 RepID=A0A1T4YD16_9BACT|nr:hypothetical protein SAMN02745166_02974 [Prosthecobacter debontii]